MNTLKCFRSSCPYNTNDKCCAKIKCGSGMRIKNKPHYKEAKGRK